MVKGRKARMANACEFIVSFVRFGTDTDFVVFDFEVEKFLILIITAASRYMRNILEGGTLAADVVIGSRHIGALRKRINREGNPERYRRWNGRRGTLVNTVRKWMKDQGWEEAEEWQWTHEGLKTKLDLKGSQGKDDKKVMHKVREAWRWKNWNKFLGTGRRDALMMQEVAYGEKRFTKAREAVKGQGRRLHLMAGAFKSPKVAAIAGRGVIHQHGKCICEGCREETLDQDHIMWGCRKRPGNAPKRPKDKLQERWGWPTGKDKQEDERVLEYMEEAVQRTWDQRYPEGKREREKKEEAKEKKEQQEAEEGKTRRQKAAEALEEYQEAEEEETEEEEEEAEREEGSEEEEEEEATGHRGQVA
jgi:hypothetical protein